MPKSLPKIGEDPADQHSFFSAVQHTKFATIFTMPVRTSKPGRSLVVPWDVRTPLVPGFENNYQYVVNFHKKGSIAGNHFHKKKEEIFLSLSGSMTLHLKDPYSGVSEKIELLPNVMMVHINTNIAHAVICNSKEAILLVTANYPNNKEDEFHHPFV